MSNSDETLQWLSCETPGCYGETQVPGDVVAFKCWRCCLGQIEHLRKQEGEYLHSIAPAAIKRARKRFGYSQAVLAFKLGIPAAEVSRAERGTTSTPHKKIIDWALENTRGKSVA